MLNSTNLSGKVAIVGVGMTRQGEHGHTSPLTLALQALREAMADAGIEDKHAIDGVLGAKQYDGSGIDAVALASPWGGRRHTASNAASK